MKPSFDVIIIGAGVVGLTAALAMARRNFSVALIDAGPLKADANQRVYALNLCSEALYQELGVWPLLENRSDYEHMHVWDAKGKGSIDFDAREIKNPKLGSIIEESCLKKALLELLTAETLVSFYPNSKVTEVSKTEARVKLSSLEHSLEAKLLFISDGANSSTRELLKVSLTSWSYQQEALIAIVELEHSHAKTAYQRFDSDGPLAFLPLKDSHQASIVWSTSKEKIESLKAMQEPEFNEYLAKSFDYKLGKVKLLSKPESFPLHMRHVKQYVGAAWLLLGDAAHTIHPMAGLGLNIGLSDLLSWLTLMDESKLNSQKALQAYQRERKQALWKVIALLSGLKYLFSSKLPPIIGLRTLGLAFCANFEPVKRLFIEQATGKI